MKILTNILTLIFLGCLSVISFAKSYNAIKPKFKIKQGPPVHAKAWGTKKPWKQVNNSEWKSKHGLKVEPKSSELLVLKHAKNLAIDLLK